MLICGGVEDVKRMCERKAAHYNVTTLPSYCYYLPTKMCICGSEDDVKRMCERKAAHEMEDLEWNDSCPSTSARITLALVSTCAGSTIKLHRQQHSGRKHSPATNLHIARSSGTNPCTIISARTTLARVLSCATCTLL